MTNKFISLDCGDDVILLEKDTYKVSKLRELVIRQFIKKWRQEICTVSYANTLHNQKPWR
jgi:hypothetical protein